jgi:L-asparagine permease
MIAIGGAIGTGLFMGAGGRLSTAGPGLFIVWYAVRGRVLEVARERVGITGNYPVVAQTPLMDEFLEKDARAADKTTDKDD